jgi:hypothetical protein
MVLHRLRVMVVLICLCIAWLAYRALLWSLGLTATPSGDVGDRARDGAEGERMRVTP